MTSMRRHPSPDVSRRFGFYFERAASSPVLIARDDVPGVVMIAASEYERLARLDHVALLPAELEQADVDAIRDACVVEKRRRSI